MELQQILEEASRIAGAILLSLPIAWNRELNTRIAGLRTFPLVAAGACAYAMIGFNLIGETGDPEARARIVQGLLSGIGFLGGGAILKNSDHVRGTASAAAIWITGAIGCACAADYWSLAVILSLTSLIIFVYLGRAKKSLDDCALSEADE